MRLNTIKPQAGSKSAKKRVGRGIGCGSGKTCGRGHKGQKSRSGGFHKVGFEGGQMPLQRRVPKFGFTSRIAATRAEVRLSEINKMTEEVIDLVALVKAKVITHKAKVVKVIKSGKLERAVTLKGILATKGATEAIQAAGGKVE